MSRRKAENAQIQEVGIDKVEQFVQTNFKQIIMFVGAVVLTFIVAYSVYTIMQNSTNNKVNYATELEFMLGTKEGIESYTGIATAIPSMKDYAQLRASEAWVAIGDNATAINEAALVSGEFKELAAGLAADLGGDVAAEQYITNGKLKPLWYYRAVVESAPSERAAKVAEFGAAYPENNLYKLVENWGN